MKVSELVKLLKANGVKLHKHGKRHDEYIAKNGKTTQVPRHQNQEMAKGTLERILKDVGLK